LTKAFYIQYQYDVGNKMKINKDGAVDEPEEINKSLTPDSYTGQEQQEIELGPDELPLRPMDASLVRWLGVLAGKDIYEDLYPEEEWQINLYRVDDIYAKLCIDLNRDGTWDEQWALLNEKVVRMVAPDDNGNFKECFEFKEYCWIKLP
jgi:hypothetical protein